MRPDPRIAEDLVTAGAITLRRSKRKNIENEKTLAAITDVETWLIDVIRRELREARP